MNSRQLLLLIASCFLVLLFFNLPANKNWFQTRILEAAEDVHDELDLLEYEERKAYRWGVAYTNSQKIKKMIEESGTSKPLLLAPSPSWVATHAGKLDIPEPIVFYYFTGLQMANPDSKNVSESNWGLLVEGPQTHLVEIKTKEHINELIKQYK